MSNALQAEPLYAKLKDRLADLIRSGSLRPGERLPSEYRLADEYAVSRATVREAVRALVAEGLIFTRRGQGTFVSAKPLIDSGLEELDTVTGMIERHGYKAGAVGTRVAIEEADRTLAGHLKLPPGAPVVRIERIRTADGDPVVLSRNKFARSLIREVPDARALDGSLLRFLEKRSGLRVIQAVATLSPIRADAELAQRMGVPRGTPFLLVEQVHYAEDSHPCLYCEDYYRSNKFRFRVVRRRRTG